VKDITVILIFDPFCFSLFLKASPHSALIAVLKTNAGSILVTMHHLIDRQT